MNSAAPLGLLYDHVEDALLTTGAQGYLNKVEVSKKSELSFEMMLGKRSQWFDWSTAGPSEIDFRQDRKVPLARWLADEDSPSLTLLSYRPRRRLTLLDERGHKPRVIKGFQPAKLDKMIRVYEHAHSALAGSGVNAPKVVEYDYDTACLILGFEDGKRLHLSDTNSDVFHRAGEALRRLQDSVFDDLDQEFTAKDELEVIDERARRLAEVAEKLPDGWAALRGRLDSALETLPEPDLVIAHRDLHDKQFIEHEHYLTLLDFDLMCKADSALDVANFLAHLVLRQLQDMQGATQQSIDTMGKKLLAGLDRNEDPGFWERLRFYQATTFCRLALVYELRPRWAGLVPALITMGHRCLDDFDRIGRQS